MQVRADRITGNQTRRPSLFKTTRRLAFVLAFLSFTGSLPAVAAQPVNQLIVKFAPQSRSALDKSSETGNSLLRRLSESAKTELSLQRAMSGESHVIRLPNFVAGDELSALIEQLKTDSSIESVEPDVQMLPQQIPLDTMFEQQWPLHSSAVIPAGMNLPVAWDLVKNPAETVVAVLDTGILPEHIDLQGRLLEGFDFISSFEVGENSDIGQYPEYLRFFRTNDGDGRDPDPSDPGDWMDLGDVNAMQSVGIECAVQNSTFHGTAMAGIIAGESGHSDGIAGIDWNAKILPVRISGKCGGSRSDMIDAIRWAAGIEDPTLPYNPTPAKIINLSLGASAACGFAEQAAINDAWEAGAILVAAAGNSAFNLSDSPSSPASCDNVIAVTAVRQDGNRAYYSNYGSSVDIAAPGGEDVGGDGKPMIVASNYGEREPVHGSHYKYVSGTSGAAAHVSGVLSLMLSVAPELSNEKLKEYLLKTTSPFEKGGYPQCNVNDCGSGVINAYAAVRAAIYGLTNDGGPEIGGAGGTDTIKTGTGGGGCSLASEPDQADPTFLLMLCLLALRLFFKPLRRAT